MSRLLATACAALGAVLIAAQSGATASAAPSGPGYTVTAFATGNIAGCTSGGDASSTCYYNADSLTEDANHVYVGYQNNGAATGASGSSIVAEYASTGGAPIAFFGPYPGKTDGLRVDPATGDLWVLNNEDANPMLRIVSSTGTATYALPTFTPHSGGYDDVAFTGVGTFLSASNPGANKNGTNTYRTLVRISFDGAGNSVINPVLAGQFVATDRSTDANVKVTITDPDSLSIDPAGDVVLNGQGDSTLVFLPAANARAGQPSVLFLQPAPTVNCGNPPAPPATSCPPIVDETTWATSPGGHFLVADHAKPGGVYSVNGPFIAGAAYTTVSSDNPTLANSLSHLDTTTGVITPVVTGFSGPKGLVFVP